MWKYYAFLSAFFAALTAILAKAGVKNIDSNVATAIRTSVILVLACLIVFASGQAKQINSLTKSNLMFLALSGLATGLSWLFYFKALQLGKASEVSLIDKFSVVLTLVFAAIFLKEIITLKVLVGMVLIITGTIIILYK